MRSIAWFREITKKHIGLVGGKGANLGEMTHANFSVPGGFVVTAQAYTAFLKKKGLFEEIVRKVDAIDVEDTAQLRAVTEEVRALIKRTPMDEELKNEIVVAYEKLGEEKLAWLTSKSKPYVAVRSSATAEDLPSASFAGQQETYLNVRGRNALLAAVKNCWASLFTARATYYRKKQGFETSKVAIAVVVQKMVDAEVSGILFTADPTGDESKIVVEAAFGLGEPVVGGNVTPDTYVVDKKKMKLLEKHVVRQEWKLTRSGAANKKVRLSAEEGRKQKLDKKTILHVAQVGRQIELHYKHPQDIEWALEKGKLFIVQSRAVTTLNLKEKKDVRAAREKKLSEVKAKVLAHGLSASPGLASGKIIVLKSSEDIEKFTNGGILVTTMTNPDWVPIMKQAAAIVTDEGGTTSHAAIVSRELGVPCVVGTSNATKVLKTGQEVTVNGYDGVVYEGAVSVDVPTHAEEKVIELKEIDRLEDVFRAALETPPPRPALEKKPVGVAAVVEDVEKQQALAKRAKEEVGKVASSTRVLAEKVVRQFGKTPAEREGEDDVEAERALMRELLGEIGAKVKVNVAITDAAKRAAKTGAAGVGLLRAEHMITASGTHPAEFVRLGQLNELVDAVKKGIRAVASEFKGKPVWYRTFDARTDEFRNLKGGENEPKEENPMLGWHGIRRDLDQPALLEAQFQAIKELREEGFTNVGVMLPFVHHASQVAEAKELAKKAGLPEPGEDFDFGVMVETPASAWTIDGLIEQGITFISFGTNDLTQLTLGLDRNNERIQQHFTELHPAILRQIKWVITACRAAGVQTSICGQAASNPEMVKHLVRFGITSVSANIDAVKDIQRVVMREEKNLLLRKFREE